MAALDRNGLTENTIVNFTSDNGCSPRADFAELAQCGHHPNHRFRGHKADIFEGGHRIPYIVRWPAVIAPGSISDQTVCLTDLSATLADILDYRIPDHAFEDSVSNFPIWNATATEPVREAVVHHSINGSFSIRQGIWKLEMCRDSGGWSDPKPGAPEVEGLPPIQLYDLSADIDERLNVQDRHPEIVETLKNLLSHYVKEGRSTPGVPQPNTGAKYWPQLHWLVEAEM